MMTKPHVFRPEFLNPLEDRLVLSQMGGLHAPALIAARRASALGPTIPVTPSVPTDFGQKVGNVRVYNLTASEFTQTIANFPLKTARVWGFNGSTPGPTLIAYRGERIRVVITNDLPDPTTVHFHGAHETPQTDGVAGISQINPIEPGQSYTYEFTPGHAGTFAYHSHTDEAVQTLRGLDGFLIVLPRRQPPGPRVTKDFAMVLQQFAPPGEGQLVNIDPEGGDFPFSTINGKTGDASGGPLTIRKGDLVQIRLYNASSANHPMHLHGHDFTVVSKNGHPVPLSARFFQTTMDVAPGDFVEIQFRADNPGNWIFHCHEVHHVENMKQAGFNGAPVGMTRVFHYAGYAPVPPEYFSYQGQSQG